MGQTKLKEHCRVCGTLFLLDMYSYEYRDEKDSRKKKITFLQIPGHIAYNRTAVCEGSYESLL